MPTFADVADVAGHDILPGWGTALLVLFLIVGTLDGLVGWFCGYLYRRQRRR